MDEQANIKASHQALVATIEEARTIVQDAVEEFLANLAQAEALCSQAKEIARAWNKEATTLSLPEDFLVTGTVMLNDVRKAVEKLDIMTPAGALVRKPLSPHDLAPLHRQTLS